MKESIGNAMIFYIVITVVAVASGLVFFSLGYSKTYKIKNKLISIIEFYNGYNDHDDTMKEEINTYLRTAGYSTENAGSICPALDGAEAINTVDTYFYCVYEHDTVKGKYYTVKVYMTYYIPVISDVINVRYSLRGDTEVILRF